MFVWHFSLAIHDCFGKAWSRLKYIEIEIEYMMNTIQYMKLKFIYSVKKYMCTVRMQPNI